MSEAKHTPGPWRVEVDTDPEAAWERQWPTIQSEKYAVVGYEGLFGDYETDMANASLIAAAPDLLDALEALADYVDERSGDNECRPLENARAAIAKATTTTTTP